MASSLIDPIVLDTNYTFNFNLSYLSLIALNLTILIYIKNLTRHSLPILLLLFLFLKKANVEW